MEKVLKNKSVLFGRVLLLGVLLGRVSFLFAVALSGCSLITTKHEKTSTQTPVDISLMDAAKSVERMANRLQLAQKDPSPAPYTGFPLPSDAVPQVDVSPATGPLASQVGLSWDGPAGPAIKAVAQYIGWKYQEEGAPGDLAVPVSVHQDAGSAFGVFQSIGRQLGHGATVIVDEANARVVLRYGDQT